MVDTDLSVKEKSRVPKFLVLLYGILDSKSSYWGADSAVECGQEVIGKGSSKDKLFKQVQLEDAAGGPMASKFQKFHRTVGRRNFKSSSNYSNWS